MTLRNPTGRTRTYGRWPSVSLVSLEENLEISVPSVFWSIFSRVTLLWRGMPGMGGEERWAVAVSEAPGCPPVTEARMTLAGNTEQG